MTRGRPSEAFPHFPPNKYCIVRKVCWLVLFKIHLQLNLLAEQTIISIAGEQIKKRNLTELKNPRSQRIS